MLVGKTPFHGANRKVVQQNIVSGKLVVPAYLSFEAQQILKKLLTRPVHKRLGYQGVAEIKKHEFFAGMDWAKLARKEIPAPFIPTLVCP
jgi:p90 ribosomal S6 kinase